MPTAEGRRTVPERIRLFLEMCLFGIALSLGISGWAGAVGPPADLPAVWVDGEVTLIHIDEIIPEQSRMAYFLKLRGREEIVEMLFEGLPPPGLRTGATVKAKGKLGPKHLWVSEVTAVEGGESSDGTSTTAPAEAVTQDRRALVMLLNMASAPYAENNVQPYNSTTAQQAGQVMFALDRYSVHTSYLEASMGQVAFTGNSSTDVFIVSIPYDNTCAYRTMANQADAAVPMDLSVYQHRVYLVPPASISGCTWLALGEVGNYGSTSVRRSWSTRVDPTAFAHELGHNLGWHHAATDMNNDGEHDVEYGDTSDLMGYCCSQRKVNSVHVDQIGWYHATDLQAQVIDITGAGRYDIAPLGTDPSTSSLPQILKITPATGRTYYLSYRQKTGQDSGMSSTYSTGVNIHRGVETDHWSYLVKVLKSDFSNPGLYQFIDSLNGITITQVDNNTNYVTVDISFGACVVQAPQVSLTPAQQTASETSHPQPISVSVTNQDSAGCEPSSFTVALDAIVDSTGTTSTGISGSLQDSSLSLDPGMTQSTTLTLQVGSVPDGTYTAKVNVTGTTESAHVGEGSAMVSVDTTPPTPPSNLTAEKSKSKGRESVKISWSQSDDGPQGSGIVGYHVYRNGTFLGTTSNLTYADNGFSSTTTNQYDVYTEDAVGQISLTPGTVLFTDSGGDDTTKSGKGGGGGNSKGGKKK